MVNYTQVLLHKKYQKVKIFHLMHLFYLLNHSLLKNAITSTNQKDIVSNFHERLSVGEGVRGDLCLVPGVCGAKRLRRIQPSV